MELYLLCTDFYQFLLLYLCDAWVADYKIIVVYVLSGFDFMLVNIEICALSVCIELTNVGWVIAYYYYCGD